MQRCILLCIFIILLIPMSHAQSTDCDTAPIPNLVIGERGRVTLGGSPNNVRDMASTEGNRFGVLAPGTQFDVLEGPVCADGYYWWRVTDGTITGWTVEGADADYWLEPVNSRSNNTNATTPSNDGLTSIGAEASITVNMVSARVDDTLTISWDIPDYQARFGNLHLAYQPAFFFHSPVLRTGHLHIASASGSIEIKLNPTAEGAYDISIQRRTEVGYDEVIMASITVQVEPAQCEFEWFVQPESSFAFCPSAPARHTDAAYQNFGGRDFLLWYEGHIYYNDSWMSGRENPQINEAGTRFIDTWAGTPYEFSPEPMSWSENSVVPQNGFGYLLSQGHVPIGLAATPEIGYTITVQQSDVYTSPISDTDMIEIQQQVMFTLPDETVIWMVMKEIDLPEDHPSYEVATHSFWIDRLGDEFP